MEILSNRQSKLEVWQNQECDNLGITIDQHNKLLEISGQISSAFGGLGNTYRDIISLIDFDLIGFKNAMIEFQLVLNDNAIENPAGQNPKYLGQKRYKSKKLRREI